MRTINFLGKDRPCYFPFIAIEEYYELTGAKLGSKEMPVSPSKMLYTGLKWGAMARGQDFDLTLPQVGIAMDAEGIDIDEVVGWLNDDMQAYEEKKRERSKKNKAKATPT